MQNKSFLIVLLLILNQVSSQNILSKFLKNINQDNSSTINAACTNLSGQWKGVRSLYIPNIQMYCLYSMEYLSTSDEFTEIQMKGSSNLIYERNQGQCEIFKTPNELEGQCIGNQYLTINEVFGFDPDLIGQANYNQILFQNSETDTNLHRLYQISMVNKHDTSLYSIDFQRYVQSFNEDATTCNNLQGNWSGKLFKLSEDKTENCAYDISLVVDSKSQSTRLVGYATNGSYAGRADVGVKNCEDQKIELIGFCNQENRILELNYQTYFGVFSKNLMVLQADYEQITIIRD